jgi:CheY-like chemotaxis protein
MVNHSLGRRVLVVDDNTDLAMTMALILRICGHITMTAFNRRDAIESARKLRPDVVLLDLTLPDGDGYEVARSLRHDLGLDEARIIAVSAYEQLGTSSDSNAPLFDHYLVKPVNMEELLRMLGPSLPDAQHDLEPQAGRGAASG